MISNSLRTSGGPWMVFDAATNSGSFFFCGRLYKLEGHADVDSARRAAEILCGRMIGPADAPASSLDAERVIEARS